MYYDKYLDWSPNDDDVKAKIAAISAEMESYKQEGTLCRGTVVPIKEFGIHLDVRFCNQASSKTC